MPTRSGEERRRGLGAAAKSVSEHLSSIVRLELELATIELKKKVASIGVGIGLGVGAAVFFFYMIGFGLASIAAGLATTMSTWLALLIVTAFLLLLAGMLGFLALRKINKGTPPVPEQAIHEAKLTTDALKSDGATT